MINYRSCFLFFVFSSVCLFSHAAKIDFVTQVQPIFEKHCYECHGGKKRKGGLRLSNKQDAFMEADKGEVVIKKGYADQSLLIQMITHADSELRMPLDKKPLSQSDVNLLKQWIVQGAEWPEDNQKKHWAYVAPIKQTLPKIELESWSSNPIDAWVYERLKEKKLSPSSPSPKAKLLRRVYFDLTGVPPSIEELDQFLADPSDKHYQRIVEELLSRKTFGEHWARTWLDMARYADSNGYQADQLRSSWAYRDWVIKALNQGMPFDQFSIEQLAGDLLPNATISQKIATGFHRTTTCNVEAGVDPEENRYNQLFDRVNTTGTVWLGTTMECAQCHNHKYDPFSQKEYYQLLAYFNNTPIEVKQTKDVTYDFYGPSMQLPINEKQMLNFSKLESEVEDLENQLKKESKELKEKQKEFEKQFKISDTGYIKIVSLEPKDFKAKHGTVLSRLEDDSILASGFNPDKDVYTIVIDTKLKNITGFRIDALTHPSLPGGKGPGREEARKRGNFIITDLQVTGQYKDGESLLPSSFPIQFKRALASYHPRNYHPKYVFDENPNTGWAIHPQFHKDHHILLYCDKIGEFDKSLRLTFKIKHNQGGQRNLGRFKISALLGDKDWPILSEDVKKILQKPLGKRSRIDKNKLTSFFQSLHPNLKQIKDALKKKKIELNKNKPPTTLVMVEMDEKRETHILKRGDFLSKGLRVYSGTPAILHANDKKNGNRLDLAKWLVSKENPLVARAMVNRYWARIMGRGLVDTLEDLGTQAEKPTHPELLDWLSVEFMEKNWSMKHIIKLIVTSSMYKQDTSLNRVEYFEVDRLNKYYARSPRIRLSAEMIRDNALKVSGLLSEKMYGPPVYPPQPTGVWRHVGRNAPKYIVQKDKNRFRRALYTVWRRGAPYVSFVNFDAPDRSSCVVGRSRTNTPLQALTLLNDPAYSEMTAALAKRMMLDLKTKDIDAKIRYGFRLCVSRDPALREQTHLKELYTKQLGYFKMNKQEALLLSQNYPLIQLPKNIDTVEFAVWYSLANVLMNLDEMVTKG